MRSHILYFYIYLLVLYPLSSWKPTSLAIRKALLGKSVPKVIFKTLAKPTDLLLCYMME